MSRASLAVSRAIDDILADRDCTTVFGHQDLFTKVHKTLDHMNSIAREVAQVSWHYRFDEGSRDDLMLYDLGLLVARVLTIPWQCVYPELPLQIEGVLRDAFDDEHFKLEDPAGWAEINAEISAQVLH